MKKQSGQLLILLLVLAGLTAAFFGLKQYNKVQSEKEEDDGITIFDTERDDIVKLTYDYEGETYCFEKEDDTWYDAEDHTLNIEQYLIKNMLSSVAPLKAEQIIENVTDMNQYGLAEPSRTIQYETEDAAYVFEVGDYNSVSSVHYIRKPGENTVYAVSSSTVTVFNKTKDDLINTTAEESEEVSSEENTEESDTTEVE